jgi:hypothetical protein
MTALKSLTNYFPDTTLRTEMSPNQKNHITEESTVSFRPPNASFCEMFNLALDATGMDRSALCAEAISAGLPSVVAARLDQIQKAGDEFLKQKASGSRQGKK